MEPVPPQTPPVEPPIGKEAAGKKADGGKGGRLGKILAFVLIALVVAGGLLTAAYFVFLSGGENKQAGEGDLEEIGQLEPLDQGRVATDPETGVQYVEGQILIAFDKSLSDEEIEKKIKSIDGRQVGYIEPLNEYQVNLEGGVTLEQLLQLVDELNHDNQVNSASLNFVFQAERTPDQGNDPEWQGEWDEYSPWGRNWGLEAIKAPSAWGYNDKLKTVQIGIVDGGFKIDHEDLSIPSDHASGDGGRCEAGANESDYKSHNNHGTHVAGTIGATSNNSLWRYRYRVEQGTLRLPY